MSGARGGVILSSPTSRYTFRNPRSGDLHLRLGSVLASQRSPNSPDLARTYLTLIRVVQLLDDRATAREGLEIAATRQAKQSGVISGHIQSSAARFREQIRLYHYQIRKPTFAQPPWLS